MNICLIRNAEHEGERVHRWPDDLTDLSSRGNEERFMVCRAFDDRTITQILSSTLVRAARTAEPLGFMRQLRVDPAPEFNALDMGQCKGMSHEESCRLIGESALAELTATPDPAKQYFPKGETLQALTDRAWGRLSSIATAGRSDDLVVIFTHEEVIGALLCRMLGVPLSRVWFWGGRLRPPLYANISEVTHQNGDWRLIHFGCTEHLGGR